MANGKTVKKKEKQTRKLNKSWKQHYEADGINKTETALKYEQRVSSLQKALSQLTQTSEKEKELHGAAQQEAEEILRERKVDEDELLFVKARMREYEKEVYGLDEAVEEAGEMRETMRGKDEEIERLLKEIDALNGEKDVVLE
ncbi:uncharacterized protein MONOS_15035 [Monocercomonoides exilis]|uniref:uncharacterized protein n=1 Tax=Monocercomonoides exilis TaxID=2049356 RepID=UPI003559A717|nr:hypothetical protein MONOS_15035 [Monocercomonoides exilis]|eukprot:MONOS_15035.1-p1 / transcript=MONOS_15035.1 / gene=MONOS_15035 / organism=Monocercomonoides_exilis_PA203 / gene_product=unspecified product / transcript_product=unspecified product / location=Mono_scaffold01131:3376-4029(+) / protein_length=143 / sequence_SO=supercontig / SO=protein_coding / is_pseudo=false